MSIETFLVLSFTKSRFHGKERRGGEKERVSEYIYVSESDSRCWLKWLLYSIGVCTVFIGRGQFVFERDSPGYPECNRSEDVIAAIPFMAYGLDLYSAMAPAAPRRSF